MEGADEANGDHSNANGHHSNALHGELDSLWIFLKRTLSFYLYLWQFRTMTAVGCISISIARISKCDTQLRIH
jgi:hypothetical protein